MKSIKSPPDPFEAITDAEYFGILYLDRMLMHKEIRAESRTEKSTYTTWHNDIPATFTKLDVRVETDTDNDRDTSSVRY